jgi:hypothetical protein
MSAMEYENENGHYDGKLAMFSDAFARFSDNSLR